MKPSDAIDGRIPVIQGDDVEVFLPHGGAKFGYGVEPITQDVGSGV